MNIKGRAKGTSVQEVVFKLEVCTHKSLFFVFTFRLTRLTESFSLSLSLSLLCSQQATGAVLVSQEPSKVILYRGWGVGNIGQTEKKNAIDAGKEGGTRPTVSPELFAAIRMECGLQFHEKEEATL